MHCGIMHGILLVISFKGSIKECFFFFFCCTWEDEATNQGPALFPVFLLVGFRVSDLDVPHFLE